MPFHFIYFDLVILEFTRSHMLGNIFYRLCDSTSISLKLHLMLDTKDLFEAFGNIVLVATIVVKGFEARLEIRLKFFFFSI